MVAEDMGLRACVYSMRTPVRGKKQELVNDVKVCRFSDPFRLLLSAFVERPLIVHGHSFGWIPSTIAPAFAKKYIFTPHIYRLEIFNTYLTKLVIRMVSQSQAIIVLTKFEASQFSPYVDEARIHVIPHPVDVHFFSQAKKTDRNEVREHFGIEDKLILTVANLVPRKNLETLLRGFKLVTKALPRSKLIIVGAEPPTVLGIGRPKELRAHYCQKLRELVSVLDMEDKVIFAGYRNNNDLRKFYATADVFALPSTVEGQLLSAGEAAAAGLPLVLSNLETLVETYDGCALFHPPLDHVSLARHLIGILTDEKLARGLSRESQEKMREYDIFSIKPKLKALYENCL